MTVSIDQSSGFCWGVVRTIEIAEDELQKGNEIYSLGDVIHNPQEIARLKDKGLQTISGAELEAARGKKVLIRAHGEAPETYKRAEEYGIEIIDATCPVVTKLQERIRKYFDGGYQIIIFGKKNHAEVIGLRGVCEDKCVVAQSVEELKGVIDLSSKTVLFSQTTMDKASFYEMKAYLQSAVAELVVDSAEEIAAEFHAKDTICGQVSGRDKKLRAFAQQNDVMIFVAGKNSSNGKVLFDICRDANSHSYFIESVDELKAEWLAGAERVGVSGATSTPMWLMENVRDAVLAQYNSAA